MTQFVICSKERCWQGVSRSKLASCWNRRSDHQARATTDLADGMCLLASEVKKLAIGELNVSHPCPKVEGMAKRKTNSQTAESSADDAEGQKDLEYLYKQFQAELGDEYLITIFRNMSPIPFQFPMCRPRWYAIGVRRMTTPDADQTTLDAEALRFSDFMQAKMADVKRSCYEDVPSWALTYMSFLGLAQPVAYSVGWERLHELPTLDEMNRVVNCQCCLDPMVVCPHHPCKCGCAGDPGKTCSWRTAHLQYLQDKMPWRKNEQGKITYVELMEVNGVFQGCSPRERSLLNIMSYSAKPLDTTLMVLDKTQSIFRCGMRNDGLVPTVATKAATCRTN